MALFTTVGPNPGCFSLIEVVSVGGKREKIPSSSASKSADNKYLRPCPYDAIDVYRVLTIFGVTDPCIQHAVKKLLCTGTRGYKSFEVDIKEAVASLTRCLEMMKEDACV